MTKILKERWMKLAGMLHEKSEPDPGEDRLKDAKHYVRNAMEALQTAIEQGLDEDQEMAKEVEGQLSTAYKKLTGAEESDRKNIGEAQFAKDALEDVDTLWQPDPDKDYVMGVDYPQPPTMIGSVQDEEFTLDDFDPEEEGLGVREPGYEPDPEYDEDKLGDYYSDTEGFGEWERDMQRYGRPTIKFENSKEYTHKHIDDKELEPMLADVWNLSEKQGKPLDAAVQKVSKIHKIPENVLKKHYKIFQQSVFYAAKQLWQMVDQDFYEFDEALEKVLSFHDVPKEILKQEYESFDKKYDTMYIF